MKQGDIPTLVERVTKALEPILQYHETGGHEGIGTLQQLASVRLAIAALLAALSQRKDAVGGGVPAGMVAYGPEHPDYPNAPKDYVAGHVQFRSGSLSSSAEGPWWWKHDINHADIIAYTPKAASSYDGDAARERIARIMYDAWPHTVISPALAEVTGLPIGEVLTWDRAKEAGADFSGLYRYADAILAAQPTSDASERLREAVQHEIDQLRTADSSWAVGIRTRLKVALSNNEVSDAK